MLYTKGNTMSEVRQLNVGKELEKARMAKPRRVNTFTQSFVSNRYEMDESDLLPQPRRGETANKTEPGERKTVTTHGTPSSGTATTRSLPVRIISTSQAVSPIQQRRPSHIPTALRSHTAEPYTEAMRRPQTPAVSTQSVAAEPAPKGVGFFLVVQVALFVVAACGMVGLLGLEQRVVTSGGQVQTEFAFSYAQVSDNLATLRDGLFAHVGGWNR